MSSSISRTQAKASALWYLAEAKKLRQEGDRRSATKYLRLAAAFRRFMQRQKEGL
jgi:hypothetical protein